MDTLSVYYLREADSPLVGIPAPIQKTLHADLSQQLRGEKHLLLLLLPLLEALFRLVSLKAVENKRTAMSPQPQLQHAAEPPLHSPSWISFCKTNSDSSQSWPQTISQRHNYKLASWDGDAPRTPSTMKKPQQQAAWGQHCSERDRGKNTKERASFWGWRTRQGEERSCLCPRSWNNAWQ